MELRRMIGGRTPWILTILISASCLSVGEARALEPRVDRRTLADHSFMPSQLIRQPLTTRSYSMLTGVGVAQADISGVGDLTLSAFGMESAVQQPLADTWGVRFELEGSVLTGVDENAALSVGASGTWRLGGGVFWNFMKGERYALTANTDLGGGQAYQLSPLAAINDAIATGTVSTAGLLIRTSSFDFRPGLSGAFGVDHWLGLFGRLPARS